MVQESTYSMASFPILLGFFLCKHFFWKLPTLPPKCGRAGKLNSPIDQPILYSELRIWKNEWASEKADEIKREMNKRNQENKSYLISSSLASGVSDIFSKYPAKHDVAANKLPGSCPIYSF